MSRTTRALSTLTASVAVLSALYAIDAGGAVAHGAHPATAGTHRLSFTAKHQDTVIINASTYVLSDVDVAAGKKIGSDVLSCHELAKASACDVAFALKGGILTGHFRLAHANGSLAGKITGGTGSFTHATGVISGQVTSRNNTTVKIDYRR